MEYTEAEAETLKRNAEVLHIRLRNSLPSDLNKWNLDLYHE